MSVQLTRMVGVCLVVALAVAAFAAPPASATTDTSVGLDLFFQDERDDDDDDDDEENEEDEEDEEDDDEEEGDDGDDGWWGDDDDNGSDDDGDEDDDWWGDNEDEDEDDREDDDGWWGDGEGDWWGDDDDEDERENCNEDDHDRGHGNDCDGVDEDNPGNGDQSDDENTDRQEEAYQPDPTPSPTATPTATPTPADSDQSDSNDDGGVDDSSEDGTSENEADAPSPDVTVAASSHEIGGFRAVRSVSTNRSTIAPGERVEIVVAVENVNDESIEVPVELVVFGEVVDSENVTVSGKSTERVRFVQQFDAPGTYQPSVDHESATVRVRANSDTTTAVDTTVPTGQVGFGSLMAIIAIGLGLLATRRQ